MASLRSSDFRTPTNPKKHLMNSSVRLLQVDCEPPIAPYPMNSKEWFQMMAKRHHCEGTWMPAQECLFARSLWQRASEP